METKVFGIEQKSIPANSGKYMGTYSARSIGHGETGIHLPNGTTGDFRIFVHYDGLIELIPSEHP